MVLLKWIEDQIPIIEEEEAVRSKEASTASSNNAKRNNWKSADEKTPKHSVLGVDGGPKVTKARKKAKSHLGAGPSHTSSTAPPQVNARSSRKIDSQSLSGVTSTEPATPRRSQRIRDLTQRKADAVQTQESWTVASKRQRRKHSTQETSKRRQDQNTESKPQGVTKRRTSKKDAPKSTRTRTSK